ncbi:MAG: cytochrome oxidase [Armatimonadetes bacterium]|nr:cytochrome oxidase [Armatimonadota bacterium]
MNLQDKIYIIALAGMGLIALLFIYVLANAGRPLREEEKAGSMGIAYRMRTWLFVILLVIFFVGTWGTLWHYPIPPQHVALNPPQVVNVTGRMWSWQIEPPTVHAGSDVEFRVSSSDVNHGFAIYGPDGRIVAQVQAMPGYTNKLLHNFDKPGTYTARCLEFCGLAHAQMAAPIQVVASKGE